MKFSPGVIVHPKAVEKLKPIWSTTSQIEEVREFRIVSGTFKHHLEQCWYQGISSTLTMDPRLTGSLNRPHQRERA